MSRVVAVALCLLPACISLPQPLSAQATGATRIAACSLLPKEEVKRHLPWMDALDQMQPEEAQVGGAGSSCNYPTVFIQVLPGSVIPEAIREQPGTERIEGVGDDAYLHDNKGYYAELAVQAGSYLLTLQANMDGDMEAVKPGVLGLARALIEKLP